MFVFSYLFYILNEIVKTSIVGKVLQQRWIDLEKSLSVVSFSRPDKREAMEDELRSIEVRLRLANAKKNM